MRGYPERRAADAGLDGMAKSSLLLPLLLVACAGPAPTTDTGNSVTSAGATEPVVTNRSDEAMAGATPTKRQLLGRWIGVEGMYLIVSDRGGDQVGLEMQYDLDHKGTFAGTVTDDGIRFDRGGETLVLRPSNGDATGLKYLAGKAECLTVQQGEGYCRA